MPERGDFQRFRSNLQGEVDGEAVYAALADAERDPKLSEVYRRLAVVEASHAEFWRKRLDQGDLRRLKLKPSGRARALAWLARRFGASFILPTIASADARDSAAYDAQADARAGGLPADERSHARIIAAAASQVGGVGGST